ncbi:prostatic acid phosphatase [Culex pipiens pallens]|uniref:prostatic acid phosphatase n=1 Tax=Culex pipiens pallens TaxID=42434 RepID=UPI00195420B2|nr:prostatic acid phosphatase [Culex pipiens pallens]XP_039448382.1 prostatic acid phosphatase [Culex pipiens pallens]XP_052566311.1 prostatic acid phosphatase [Culex pipiens pallens]
MYSLSRRVIIMLSGAIALLVLVTIFGVYGAPTAEHLLDVPDGGGAESRLQGDDLIEEDRALRDYELKQVHVFFRHGQRTAADTYPTDPLINQTFAPYGWGQLTNYGKETLYDIGTWLRHRYGKLLGKLYYPEKVHAQSTGVSRTQMSIELVLAALYPPEGTVQEWNHDLNWQPIPFFSEPLDQDTLLLVRKSCPRYHEAANAVLESGEIRQLMVDNLELFDNLTRITGMDIRTPDDVQSLYATLRAESEFGLTLPEWTRDYYPEKLLPLTKLSYVLNVYNDELKKLKGGPFLKKTLAEWDAVIANEESPKNKKMFVYAGHDSTVVNLLSVFNVWREQFPNYAIMGLLELHKHKRTGEYTVRIFQKNVGEPPIPLTIPGCAKRCPVDQLKELLKSHVPIDMVEDCKAHGDGFEEPPPRGP